MLQHDEATSEGRPGSCWSMTPGGAVRRSVRAMTNHRLQLSRPAVITATVAAIAGLASGVVVYLHRSEQVEQQVPGTEAWLPHLVVLGVVAIWFVVASRRSPLGWKV